MRILSNGREVDIATDENGRADAFEVRRALNIPDDRAIIQQKPSGENFILPRHGQITINPYEHFMDSPRGTRGKI